MRRKPGRLQKVPHFVWVRARDLSGQSLVEYGLILILVVVLCVTALAVIGRKTVEPIDQVANLVP